MYLDLGSCLKGGKPTLLTPPSTLEINALLNTVWRREHQHCTAPHFTHEKSMYSSYKPILTTEAFCTCVWRKEDQHACVATPPKPYTPEIHALFPESHPCKLIALEYECRGEKSSIIHPNPTSTLDVHRIFAQSRATVTRQPQYANGRSLRKPFSTAAVKHNTNKLN